jgi:hypothetical protein
MVEGAMTLAMGGARKRLTYLAAGIAALAAGCGGQPVRVPRAAATVTVTQGPTPTIRITADKKIVVRGRGVTYTVRIGLPPKRKGTARNVALQWQTDSRFRLAEVKAPRLISNAATVTWQGRRITTVPAVVRVRGTWEVVSGLGDRFTLALGDFAPGDSADIKVTCIRKR